MSGRMSERMFDDLAQATRNVAHNQTHVAIATLTAGIVQARNATTVAEIRQAHTDAMYILYPAPRYAPWVEWAQRNGVPAPEVQPRVSAAE